MPRSVPVVAAHRKRKKILKRAKGYWGRRGNVYTVAKNAVEKGLTHAYKGRKLKKRVYRSIWIVRINAAVRAEGMSYSKFIKGMELKNIKIDRKTLADLAMNHPVAFKEIIATVKAA